MSAKIVRRAAGEDWVSILAGNVQVDEVDFLSGQFTLGQGLLGSLFRSTTMHLWLIPLTASKELP
ncbi:MAG: hypothetical protein NC413_09575, partial [Muribaculum sp.]|nr:hypothetical protein [Muribaculum sp.]